MPVIVRWFLRLGPVNPIAVRLVQGGSRRRRHLYIRASYLGALILALLYLLLLEAGGSGSSLTYRGMASAASSAFEFVAYLQIALICLLAPVFMAGAIAQEANPRTWDILLTTPMSASEIVLGNLFGRLFFILALLFASLPLFALTQYFGGVPGVSIFGSYAIAASAALLVGALAIALSVSRLVGKRAVFAFYIGVVSYLAITWAADKLTRGFGAGATYVSWMTALNPFLALEALLNPSSYMRMPEGSQRGPAAWFLEKPVTTWCALSCGLSLVLMLASTITVRAGGLAGFAGSSERAGPPWYRRIFGLSAKGAEHRAPRQVWTNPIAWREAAARNATLGRMIARWSFIGLGALWGLSAVLYFHFSGMRPDTFRTVILTTVIGELAVITLVALNMSATAVSKEREDGTLDLLLTTPITPAAYLGGKVRGMVAYLLPLLAVPVGTLLLSGMYVMLAMWGVLKHPVGVEVTYRPPATAAGAVASIQIPAILPEAGIVLAIVTVPFIAFCCMVGLSWSLKSKGTIGSVVATVGVVGVIAGIVGMCAFQSGRSITFVGPALAALSPATVAFASIFVEDALTESLNTSGGLEGIRAALLIGGIISGAIWIALVYGLRSNMTHNFDMTVRRLAGTA